MTRVPGKQNVEHHLASIITPSVNATLTCVSGKQNVVPFCLLIASNILKD